MSTNPVKDALQRGEVVAGTFFMEFASGGAARIAGVAGARFAFFDMQHTGWSTATIGAALASADRGGAVPMVRVPAPEPWLLGQLLDLGARGLMVPAVQTAAQAAAIVAATRYPPAGDRAVTFSYVHDGYRPPADAGAALRAANDAVLVFCQIETARGLSNVEEIAAVDGVDVLWVGDNDLAASLGIPGRFEHPDYLAALDRVAAAATAAGKTAGFTTASETAAADLLARGYRCLAYGNDIKVFGQALRAGIETINQLATKDR